MAVSLKHSFQSAKSDGTDSTLVQPSNWNAEHTLTLAAGKVLGRDSSGAGAAQELPLAFDATLQSMIPPSGTTAQRPASPTAGMLRYNSTTAKFEGYTTAWGSIGGGAAISDTSPASPSAGDLWWNSTEGQMYIYYNDGTSAQWVIANAFTGGTSYLPLTGGTVTGPTSFTSSVNLATSSGNVGIGTASPTTKLDVSGNVDITAPSSADTQLRLTKTGSVNAAIKAVTGALTFGVDGSGGGTERFRIGTLGQWGLSGANYGTSGQVLTSQGASSAPAWTTLASLTRGTAVASTSGTAIDFTGIPSTAKRVTVVFNGVSTNGNSDLIIQIGSGSFVTSGYASGVFSNNSIYDDTTSGFMLTANTDNTLVLHGVIPIMNITGNTWSTSHVLGNSTPGISNSHTGGGSVTLSGALDRVRVTTLGGSNTFDAGNINIFWE